MTASGCRLGGNPFAHRLDLADIAPCLRVALELAVDGLDGPAQRGQVCRAGGEEAQPPAAQNRGVGPLVAARHVRLGGLVAGDRPAEDAPLRWGERGPGLAVGEQDERPRPQADIRGQVPPGLVVLVALDRADLLFDPIQAGDRPGRRKPDGRGAEGAHRRVSDQRLLDPHPEPGVIRWPQQRAGNPERLAERPGQHANPGQPERPQPPQHLPGHRTAQDTILQRVAGDQKRRAKRPEAADAGGVPRPAAGQLPDRPSPRRRPRSARSRNRPGRAASGS